MIWTVLLTALGLATAVVSINRPVYKVILTQKGFTQFLQYELSTPAVREFTLCVWVRFHEFGNEQSIFSYIVDRNHRLLRLWVDAQGSQLTVSFAGESTSVPVELDENLWRHVCLSYQSDYGAWALYIDSRLAICKVVQGFHRYVFPGGSIILGYGTGKSGKSNGLEGELFGVNMILTSTIERNNAIKVDPYIRKTYKKSNFKLANDDKYVILNDLMNGSLPETTTSNLPIYMKLETPTKIIEQSKITRAPPTQNKLQDLMNDLEIFHLLMDTDSEVESIKTAPTRVMDLNIPSRSTYSVAPTLMAELELTSDTTLSEFETPPSTSARTNYYFQENLEIQSGKLPSLLPISDFAYNKLREEFNIKLDKMNHKMKSKNGDLPDREVSRPPKRDPHVYGHWTSSKYAGIVLDHLKRNSKNTVNNRYKVPATIPLVKVSDKYPYPSTFKQNGNRPLSYLRDMSSTTNKIYFDTGRSQADGFEKVHYRIRRAETLPNINVKIIEDDIRNEIMNAHAETKPKNVRITSRSQPFFRRNNTKEKDRYSVGHEEFLQDNLIKNNQMNTNFNRDSENSLINIMPFLKSVEFYTGDGQHVKNYSENIYSTTENDIYAKIIAKGNKWHNIKSYNNDYTPRRTPGDLIVDMSETAETNKRHPFIRLKYKPDVNKMVSTKNDASLIDGITLAMDVSNHTNAYKKRVSLFKYNHGYLPGHTEKAKFAKNFHNQVKLGNALNEKKVFARNDEKKKESFYEREKNIRDIQKFINNNEQKLSMRPLECKNVELLDHILYAHADGSIDLTHIVSPVRTKNVAVEFVLQNYQKCSLDNSPLENDPLIAINWAKTPVRLFGGVTPKRTTDLCGFF